MQQINTLKTENNELKLRMAYGGIDLKGLSKDEIAKLQSHLDANSLDGSLRRRGSRSSIKSSRSSRSKGSNRSKSSRRSVSKTVSYDIHGRRVYHKKSSIKKPTGFRSSRSNLSGSQRGLTQGALQRSGSFLSVKSRKSSKSVVSKKSKKSRKSVSATGSRLFGHRDASKGSISNRSRSQSAGPPIPKALKKEHCSRCD